jgi:hypothetical protein
MYGLSDGVTGALIGAVAVLLVGLLTVVAGAWVAARQLRHDREERATDRALQSKRDKLFTSLSAASDVTRSISALARPGSSIPDLSDRFSDAVNALASGGSVASLEVVSRGRDLVGHAGRLFLIAMAKRAALDKKASLSDWMEFGDWAIAQQVELQGVNARLLAAVRRDLGIPNSTDEQVFAATAVDVEGLQRAATEAREILTSD